MSNKWWIVALGLVALPSSQTFAMDVNELDLTVQAPRNSLSCSTEVKKEAELVAAAIRRSLSRSNSGELHQKKVESFYCNGSISGYYYYGKDSKDMRPYYSDFPGHNHSGY